MKKVLFINLCILCALCGNLFTAEPLPLSSVKYWCYQIQDLDSPGAVDAIVNSKYDMVVLDPMVTHDFSFDTKTMVKRIKSSMASDGVHRKLVIAYIDIGQAEEWRWYWDGQTTYEENGQCLQSYVTQIQAWAPFVVACDPDGWAGNYPVAFWDDAWKDIVIDGTTLGSGLGLYYDSMLDEVVQDGFDGIYLDWVESWEMDAVRTRAQNEGKDPGREMLKFIRQMRTYGRQYNGDFIVIQQNSSELINEVGATDLKTAVDAIAQEGIWWDGDAVDDDWSNPAGFDQVSCCTNYYLTRLRKYVNAGFPVFVADYAVQQSDDVYTRAASEGFVAYATRRPLNRLTTTPPTFSTTPAPVPVALPFGRFETPKNGDTVSGSVAFTGWALDDSGIASVNIQLLAADGDTWTAIDTAILIENARPDVAAAFPGYPGNTKAGWGYMMLTHFLPGKGNGFYTFRALVTDASGQSAVIGTSTIMIDNDNSVKPFGAIDTPLQGDTISGSHFVVHGWALTPVPNAIPTDGSTITVLIDNKPVGHPVYGQYRPDIPRFFPGYENSDTAAGYFILDTTTLSNGVHTIQWTVRDNAGNTDGIGSRFFTVAN